MKLIRETKKYTLFGPYFLCSDTSNDHQLDLYIYFENRDRLLFTVVRSSRILSIRWN